MEFDEWIHKEKQKVTHAFFTVDSIGEGRRKLKQAQERCDLLELASFDGFDEEFKELQNRYLKCMEARDALEMEYNKEVA